MGTYQKLPQLTFVTAVKLACSRLFDFKGRSRRSEFWWFILALILFKFVASLVYSQFLSAIASELVGTLLSFLAVPAMVRRLHDRGLSGLYAWIGYALSAGLTIYLLSTGIVDEIQSVNGSEKAIAALIQDPVYITLNILVIVLGIFLFVFYCLDGKPQANKYGESPKYIPTGTMSTEEVFKQY